MKMSGATKTCKLCCMEIPEQARKCPYCLHFQDRRSTILHSPGLHVLLGMLPPLVVFIMIETMFSRGENYESYKDQISVADSQIAFGDTKSGATIAVIGTITNHSEVSWKEVQFHVEFVNAAGKRVDVGEREEYSFELPARQTTSFKVSFRREFPETNYARAQVRVVGAKDARARW